MTIGTLQAQPVRERPDLVAPSVSAAIAAWSGSVPVDDVVVAEIDPGLADTAAFCERYGVRMDRSANCVVLAARREGHFIAFHRRDPPPNLWIERARAP